MVLVAVIGILGAVGLPWLINFYRAQQLDGVGRRVSGLIQQGRQLAITRNTPYRVEMDTANSRIRFVRVSDGAAWTGPGTDASGYQRIETEYVIDGCSRTSFVFTALGTLDTTTTPAGTVRVRNAANTQRLDVAVNAAGRVLLSAAATCP